MSGVILWEGDPETLSFTYVSPAAEAMLGYPASRWVEDPGFWVDKLHPDDRDRAIATCVGETRAGRNHEFDYRMIAADGRAVWLRDAVFLGRGADGRPVSRGLMWDITDWKRAEDERRELEDRFRIMSESAPVMIWVSDEQGRCLHLNRRLREFWGVSERDIGAFDWNGTLHPEDAAWAQPLVREAFLGRRAFSIECRFRKADEGYRLLRAEANPRFSSAGRFLGMTGVNTDVTEERAAQDALLASEARYRAVVESQTELVCRFAANGALVFVNDGYARALGSTPGQLRGVSFWGFIPEAERSSVAALLEGLRPESPEVRIENRIETASGVRWMLWTNRALSFDDAGRWTEAQSTGVDITDRRRAEEALRESEARFRNMADSAPVMVWVTDPEGACTYMSASWCEFTGKDPSEALGLRGMESVHPDDRPALERAWAEAIARRATFSFEHRMRRADGSYAWVLGSARPRFDAEGIYLGFIGSVFDIDERRQAEEHRKLLLDELNHRVKNSLAVVQGIAKQTFRPGADLGQAARAFEGRLIALAAAHGLLTLESWRSAELQRIAEDALRPSGALRERIRVGGPKVMLAPKQALAVAMALHELASNAIKYGSLSSDVGTVDLAWTLDGRALEVTWRERGGPPVAAPAGRGFGSTMIERALAHELGGEAVLQFAPEGVSCIIRAPLKDERP